MNALLRYSLDGGRIDRRTFVARAAAAEHHVIEPLCDDLLADAPTDDDIAMLAVHVGDG